MIKFLGENLEGVTAGDDKKTLVQANGVFLQKGVHLEKAYNDVVSEYFKAVWKEVRSLGSNRALLLR